MSYIILQSRNYWPKCDRCGYVNHTPTTIANLLPKGWLWIDVKIYCPRCARRIGMETDEIVHRWNKLAERLWLTGMDLSTECRQLGQDAVWVNSNVDKVYIDYVQLYESICTQVDAINEKIRKLVPTL